MKHLYILRGPSGCGKSTLAEKLRPAFLCSADYFFVDMDNEYHFDKSKLTEAHAQCKRVCEHAMERKAESIVIDNTNMKVWEYMPYVELAKKHGYSYSLIVVGQPWNAAELAKRNIHGLTEDQIRQQIARFAHFI